MQTEIEMNINQAVKHLAWRLQQPKMIPNDKDKEAFNFILNTLNRQFEDSLQRDKMLAKMVIEKLMMLTLNGKRPMKKAISIVKEILGTPLTEWLDTFKSMVPMIRTIRALEVEYVNVTLGKEPIKNAEKVREVKNKLADENVKRLADEFKKPYTDAELKIFITTLLFDLRTEFQNKP